MKKLILMIIVLFNNLYSYEKFSSYSDIVNWRGAPHNVQVEMKGKVYTHVIDSNKSLDFWTDNPAGDGQEYATEVFTGGDRRSLPVITHNIIALTKELGNHSRYSKDGIRSTVDNNFYQWYYLNDPKSTTFIDINSSWVGVGNEGFSDGDVTYTKIAIDSKNVPYVIYRDNVNLSKATVKRYDEGTNSWVNVGGGVVSKDIADYLSIVIDSNDTVYVMYRDKGEASKGVVKKYNKDKNIWEDVGEGVISNGIVYYAQVVIDSKDVPYIIYRDGSNGSKATVKKFNGFQWEVVGQAGFSKGVSDFTSIALDNKDVPYVVYRDKINLYKSTVQRYNKSSSSWEVVGNEGFSDGDVTYTKIAIDSKNVPYVIYRDNVNLSKATVKRYDEGTNSWVNVGGGVVSKDIADYLDIKIDKYDVVYVTYRDKGELYKGIVKRYNKDINNWEEIGIKHLSDSYAYDTSIALNNFNVPYVVYRDKAKSLKVTVRALNSINKNLVDILKDTVAPQKPYLTIVPTVTKEGSLIVEVNGEVGSKVYVNGVDTSIVIPQSGKVNVTLDTSGNVESKDYEIVLKDGADNYSEGLKFIIQITRPRVVSSRVEVLNLTLPHNSQVELNGKVYTHVIDGNKSLDFWTDNSAGDGQEYATEVFTGGDRSNLPVVTHNIIALTKELGNHSRYSKDGIKSIVDGNFYQWYYAYNPNATQIIDYDGVFNFVGENGVSLLSAYYTSIAMSSKGIPYIIYRDSATASISDPYSSKATVRRYINNGWETVSGSSASLNGASYTSIVLDSNDVPYIAYSSDKTIIQKYEESVNKWVSIGQELSRGEEVSIVLDAYNIPYIVYREISSNKIIVQRYDKSINQWEIVGNSGFSGGYASNISMAISKDGILYVAYRDAEISQKLTVKRFINNQWESVGETPSLGDVFYTSIAIDSNNIPYISYQDRGYSLKVIVKRFINNNWEFVGEDPISTGSVKATSIAIGLNNIPYMAYSDNTSDKVIVKQYNKNIQTWEMIGNTETRSSGYLDLAIASNNIPYIIYQDTQQPYKAVVKHISYFNKNLVDLEENLSITSIEDIYNLNNDVIVWGNDLFTKSRLNGDTCYKNGKNQYITKNGYYLKGNSLPQGITCLNIVLENEAILVHNRNEIVEWETDDAGVKVKIGEKIFTHVIDKEEGLDYWTNNVNEEPTIITEIFTKGNLSNVPTVYKDTIVLTKRLDGYNKFTPRGMISKIDSNFYQWYYSVDSKLTKVLKDDSNWQLIGLNELGTDSVEILKMTFDNENTPYVLFKDSEMNKLLIKRLNKDTNRWEIFAENILSSDEDATWLYGNVELVFDENNNLYITYMLPNLKVKKFNSLNNTFETIDTNGLYEFMMQYDFNVDLMGSLYVAYSNYDSGSIVVQKYNATVNQWEIVGEEYLTAENMFNISLKFDKKNVPYLLFGGENSSYNLLQYDMQQNIWKQLRTNKGTDEVKVSMDFDFDDNLYLAITTIDNKISVKKYDQKIQQWIQIGDEKFIDNLFQKEVIKLNGLYKPFVIGMNSSLLIQQHPIKQFNSVRSQWESVGSNNFSENSVSYLDFIVDKNGVPFVLFYDYILSHKVFVKSLESINKNLIDKVDFTSPNRPFLSTMPTITNKEIVIVEVNGEVGSKVYVNGVDTSIVIPQSGKVNVTLDTSGNVESKDYEIVLKDGADNYSERLKFNIVIDRVNPTISTIVPSNGFIVNNQNVRVLLEYSDNSSIDVTRSILKIDNLNLSHLLTPNMFEYQAIFDEGIHSIYMNLSDKAGNSIEYEYSFTVDITAPSKPIFTVIPTETIENNLSLEINGEVGSKVYVNGVDTSIIIPQSGKIIVSLNTSGIYGIKSFYIYLKDLANNIGESLNINISKVPPIPMILNTKNQQSIVVNEIIENNLVAINIDAIDQKNYQLTYKLETSKDSNLFNIDQNTGEITFKDFPNYEKPIDINQDNQYELDVKVENTEGGFITQKINIIVQDDGINPPNKPIINSDKYITNQNSHRVEVIGENNTNVYVNGINSNITILQTQRVNLDLNLTGQDGNKTFEIILVNAVKDYSEATIVTILKDTVAPQKPYLTIVPTVTKEGSLIVEVNGEVGSKVYVNGVDTSIVIPQSGKVNVTLDTSGNVESKDYEIVLKDGADNYSEGLKFIIQITRPRVVSSRVEVLNLTLPHNSQVELNGKVYTHVIDGNKSLDFWTDNSAGDGQEYATEVFTGGDRSNLPVVTHLITALTKNIGTQPTFQNGIISNIDNSFYQWYYMSSQSIEGLKASFEIVGGGNLQNIQGTTNKFSTIFFDIDFKPYVVYNNANFWGYSVKKFIDNSWSDIGHNTIFGIVTTQNRFNFDNSFNYFAYVSDSKGYIKKLSGNSWITLGEESNYVDNTNVVKSKKNEDIYIALNSQDNRYKGIVKKFTNGQWVKISDENISERTMYNLVMDVDKNDIPYVLYEGSDGNLNVKKFYNGSWQLVGTANIATGLKNNGLSLKISNDFVPYILYKSNSNNIILQKLDNTSNWKIVDNSSYTSDKLMPNSLVLDQYGLPYIVYSDLNNSGSITVKHEIHQTLIDKVINYLPAPKLTYTPNIALTSTVTVEVNGNSIGEKVYLNGEYVAILNSSKKAILTLNTSGEEGYKYFRITLLNPVTNEVSYPLDFSILIDKSAPKVLSGWPTKGSVVKLEDKQIGIIYTFVDQSTIASIEIFDSNGINLTSKAIIDKNTIKLTIESNNDSDHNFTIKATDILGNQKVVPLNFMVKVSTPVTIATKPSGEYDNLITVSLVTSEENATIYYTTDGTLPIVGGSTTHHGGSSVVDINIPTTTNLQFFAIDNVGNKEDLQSRIFRIGKIDEFDTTINAYYNETKKQIELSWNSVSNTKEYKIYKITSAIEYDILKNSKQEKYNAPKLYLIGTNNVNSFIDTNIQNGAKYFYAISRVDAKGVESVISELKEVSVIAKEKAISINDAILRAKNWLIANQNSNGSWGINENTKLLATTTILDALYEYKSENQYLVDRGIGYIAGKYPNNNDYLSRQISTLGKYSFYIENRVNKLISEAEFLNYSSVYKIFGWGLTKYYKINPYDTTIALEALDYSKFAYNKSQNIVYNDTIKPFTYDVINYLSTNPFIQSKNGKWGWMPKGEDSIYVSAKVYNKVGAQPSEYSWIVNTQNSDGSFGNGLLDTIGVVFYLELEKNKMAQALSYITSQQTIMGDINNDPYLTALALQALQIGVK